MKNSRYHSLVFMTVLLIISQSAVGTALDDYVLSADNSFSYKLVRAVTGKGYTGYILDMTSQKWRSEDEVDRTIWQHFVHIAVPDTISSDKAMLIISGGRNGKPAPANINGRIASIASQTNSICALVETIPNEPLAFKDEDRMRWEDAIIAYSWDKFMKTGDKTWPAQLPMVKSAVRAMDAVQDFISDISGNVSVNGFVVAGASKRGWTTWLTAAVDKRVTAICPLVIDMLNTQKSFVHHHAVYGFYAPAVHDYEEMKIFERMLTDQSDVLMSIVDPLSYNDRLTMPKFMINAAGDQFFLPDSSQFYYDRLKSPKYIRYVPNTDHSLKESDFDQSLLMFYISILNGYDIPEYSFEFVDSGTIRVQTESSPSYVKLWQATNPDARDFRLDTIGKAWVSSGLEKNSDGFYVATVQKPEKGFTAFFVEITFPGPGPYPYKFTTGIKVIPDTLPYADKNGN